jgi:hypothetical protein
VQTLRVRDDDDVCLHGGAIAMPHNILPDLLPLATHIDQLHLDPANARKHNPKNLDAIKSSLAKFGQRKPIVVQREGMIVRAGNGTLQAARALGWDQIAAVIVTEDNSSAAQFAIADNRTAELAEWETETLATLLDGWDEQTRNALGFDQADIDQMMAGLTPTEVGKDEVPEPPVDPITKPGDLWILGNHRLLCGDSTDQGSINRALNGAIVALQIVDPPFDADYSAWPLLPTSKVIMVWQRGDRATLWEASHVIPAGYGSHELVFQGGVRGWPCDWFPCTVHDVVRMYRNDAARKQYDANVLHASGCRTIEDGSRPFSVQEHAGGVLTGYGGMSWGKALVAMELAMSYIEKGECVYDACAGSGTSLIAAHKHGRRWLGVEQQPKWADLIVQRWEEFTGQKAVREHG